MTNVAEIIRDAEPLIREKVRVLLIRKLSIWDGRTNFPKVIDEETEGFMNVIRPALWRVGEKDE